VVVESDVASFYSAIHNIHCTVVIH
jgi:hypothetical protein